MSMITEEKPADQDCKTQAHGTTGADHTGTDIKISPSNNIKRRHVNGQGSESESVLAMNTTTPPVEGEVTLTSPVDSGSSGSGMYGTFPSASRPSHYEELFGGSMTCPTCRGSGRIPRDTADEMVALIPVRDKRLRPRRTCLYVCVAIGICVLVGGLLMYFLLPRNIKLESQLKTLHPTKRVVNRTEQIVFLTVTDQYNITNSNYFPLYVTQLNVAASFDQKIVGSSQNDTRMTIPMRATITYSINLNITFSGSEGYIAYYCSTGMPGSHSILMPFVTTMSSTYLGHSEDTTLQTYKHVLCGPQHKNQH